MTIRSILSAKAKWVQITVTSASALEITAVRTPCARSVSKAGITSSNSRYWWWSGPVSNSAR